MSTTTGQINAQEAAIDGGKTGEAENGNAMDNTIFVFPGQGSQMLNMGKEIIETYSCAKEVLEEVSDVTGIDLSALIFGEDADALKETDVAQPALMAISISVLRALQKESGMSVDGMCKFVAGHSLGEYSALCASGALSLRDASTLLKVRGLSMKGAFPSGGAMAALLGCSCAVADEIVAKIVSKYGSLAGGDESVIVVANDNSLEQVVISGHEKMIDKVVQDLQNGELSEFAIRKCVKLATSGPFHSPLMLPAANAMQDALADVSFGSQLVPCIFNTTASTCSDADEIKNILVNQVCGKIKWRESMLFAKQNGVSNIVEIGSGKVLTGLARRIFAEGAAAGASGAGAGGLGDNLPPAKTYNIENVRQLMDFVESLRS